MAVKKRERVDTPNQLFEFPARQGLVTTHSAEPRLSQRLALEMDVHVDLHRGTLDGELPILEAAWREAEEIASIADDLLLSRAAGKRLARNRGRR